MQPGVRCPPLTLGPPSLGLRGPVHPMPAGHRVLSVLGSSSSRIVGAFLWWGQDLARPGPPGVRELPDLHLGSIPGQGVEGLNYQPDQGRVRLLSLYHEHKDGNRHSFTHSRTHTHMVAGTHTSALTRPGPALGSRFSTDRPGPVGGGCGRGCGRGCGWGGAGLWVGWGGAVGGAVGGAGGAVGGAVGGVGGDPPDAVQSAHRQSSWCRNRARGAAQRDPPSWRERSRWVCRSGRQAAHARIVHPGDRHLAGPQCLSNARRRTLCEDVLKKGCALGPR